MKRFSFHDDVLPLKDQLFRLALRITLNAAEAEDVVQETLIRVWQQREEWPKIRSMEAYCMTICRRLALNEAARACHANVTLEEKHDTPSGTTPFEQLAQSEQMNMLRKLMDSLPGVQRSILQLRDIEGFSYQEIASVLELDENQVKVYLYRARQRIRLLIEETENYGL